MWRSTVVLVFAALAFSASSALSQPEAGYYYLATNKSGDELKSALHSIIDGHRRIPYTRSNNNLSDKENLDVWEAMLYTDADCPNQGVWCGDVRLLYLGIKRNIDSRNRGMSEDDSWDREHVFPASYGFKRKSQHGHTDLHHLRPADRNLNGSHSNLPYCEGGENVFDEHDDGTSSVTTAKVDKSRRCFEPTDIAKGEVARMIFYMAVRYEAEDRQVERMLDLEIVPLDQVSLEGKIGDLCTLLRWNRQYLPTQFERTRNDRVYDIQGNRNPFIDNPKWADQIWGNKCN